MLTRRHFIGGAASIGAGAMLGRARAGGPYTRALGPAVAPGASKTVAARLTAAERPTALPCFGGRPLPMWTFADDAWPPLIRLNLGDRLEATLENRLPRAGEFTSIHWHGIRLPNDQDGVPYLIQAPVEPGGSFRYSFAPPDAGTFFFHTHCNTVEQLGRGLEGVIVIDGDITEPYDIDKVLLLRDWRIDADSGQFDDFYTLRGAGRAGSYGSVRSVNGATNPEIALPALGDCRLRVVNTDPTRVMQIAVEDAEAAIVAIDGIAVQPFPLTTWWMGTAMRIDLVMRAPSAGETARLIDRSPPGRVELAHFVGSGPARRKTLFDPAPLRAGRIPEPDLNAAERLKFVFQASEAGQILSAADSALGAALGSLCLSQKIFWTINGRPWPDRNHARLPPPLAVLKLGRSYIFTLKNDTPFSHPIHIHGHTFKLLRSSKQKRPQHHADTVLLLPEDEVEVAFVADNPGNWMFHCHIIEHQESGMMGYIRVA